MTEAQLIRLAETAPLEDAVLLGDGRSYYVFDDERCMWSYTSYDYIVITDGDGTVVGCAQACLSADHDRPKGDFENGDIFLVVKPEYRGRGFASDLARSGELRRVFPDVVDVTISSDALTSEDDFERKLHLCELAGYHVANKRRLRAGIASGRMFADDDGVDLDGDGSGRELYGSYGIVFERLTWCESSARTKWLDAYLDDRNDALAKKCWLLWHTMDRYRDVIECANKSLVSLDEEVDVVFDEAKPNPLQRYCDAVADIIGEHLSVDEMFNLKLIGPCGWMADAVCDYDGTGEYDMGVVSYRQRMSRHDLMVYRMVLRLAGACRERGWHILDPV